MDTRELRENRRLTEEGRSLFQETVQVYLTKLTNSYRSISYIIEDIRKSQSLDNQQVKDYIQDIMPHWQDYVQNANKFRDYLKSVRSQESARELAAHNLVAKSVEEKVRAICEYLDSVIKSEQQDLKDMIIPPPQQFQEHQNETYQNDQLSQASSTSSLARQKAKLEIAKTREKYAQEEIKLMKKQTDLEANLKLLNARREIEEAECELKAYSEVHGEEHMSNVSAHNIDMKDDIQKRTADYILEHNQLFDNFNAFSIANDNHLDVHLLPGTAQQVPPKLSLDVNANPFVTQTLQEPNIDSDKFVSPVVTSHRQMSTVDQIEPMKEFSKYLMKKDILLGRLTRYDDNPGYFLAWKTSFKNVVEELNVTPSEEIDLLIKWLGPESSKQALSIRAASAANPAFGVEKIWTRLEDRFGSPELVESSLKKKLENFGKIGNKDNKRLFELVDIINEIEAIKANDIYKTQLSVFDSSTGVNSIISKLPYNIQERWTSEANSYKLKNHMIYPPFSVFSEFMHRIAKMKNDPSFFYEERETKTPRNITNSYKRQISCAKTDTSNTTTIKTPVKQNNNLSVGCPLHGTNHSLNACRAFRTKPISERKDFLKKNGLCFRCCGEKRHLSKDCKAQIKCTVCQRSDHATAMHLETDSHEKPRQHHEGESTQHDVSTSCTRICGKANGGKSCAKIVLATVHPKDKPDLARKMYCLIDDQSNRSLASTNFFEMFHDHGPEVEYLLSSCSGKVTSSGRLGKEYIVESFDSSVKFNLPTLIECNDIPNNREEIASPSVASQFAHLRDIAQFIPEIDSEAQIDLLIGRDLIGVHHVLDHRMGDGNLPYAQRLPLGWVIIGEVCLGKVHQGNFQVCVNKTSVLSNGRTSLLPPCSSDVYIKDIFRTTDDDEKVGSSIEDDKFMELMESGFVKDTDNRWTAPLPFRDGHSKLENNRPLALKRAKSFDYSLNANPKKKEHTIHFMDRLFDNGHAEIAPQLKAGCEAWYLPMFGVYHPRKPESIRVVFDASAVYNNNSLNKVLLNGPDLTNSLLGILMRFRKEAIAVTADIEQMFYNFKVCEPHRDYLRFIWHAENDIEKPLQDFRMTVHVFGNGPSPAIATYGLRKSVESADPDVKDYVDNNFYVDDGLISCESVDQAVSLVKRTQNALLDGGNLRLHKIALNSKPVLEQFCNDDLAKNLRDVTFENNDLPMQRSLGMSWNINTDCFTFQVSNDIKPFTKRGVLSTINGLFDPIGFTAPVSIQGKLLLREMMSSLTKTNWDDPLPETYLEPWTQWTNSLPDLENFEIPRMYSDISFASSVDKQVHIFSDASKDAIAAVAYLKLFDVNHVTVSFLLGKAKVAPVHGSTIPRLELCAAVLAAELGDSIKEHLKIDSDSIYYYTDSKVVLGYLTNESKRFFVYVGNRVRRIRSSCSPKQWTYVSTDTNPADLATRGKTKNNISAWIHGPNFLVDTSHDIQHDEYELVNPQSDKEIRPDVRSSKTLLLTPQGLGIERFSRFSDWNKLVRAITSLRRMVFRKSASNQSDITTEPDYRESELLIIREVQLNAFGNEIECLKNGLPISRNSTICSLSPFMDSNGVLRVGGRLRNAELSDSIKHPIILPKKDHVSTLLVHHFHNKVGHQGRHITDGAIRDGGYWIIGSRRLVYTMLQKCVTCKRLRGKFVYQQMADLPEDRLKPSPPFTFVGVDTFGPWPVAFRKTRGVHTAQKRWALLFTCLVCRAIHIEVIEELSSASFINALRRFIAIRGPVQQFRSDRGTNFIGATGELNMLSHFVEKGPIQAFFTRNRVTWIFNPPHASHMGGVWERMIGVTRNILNGMLLRESSKTLTHEVLVTLLSEVTAIVNARPLIPVSTDPDSPDVLCPASLLTFKSNQHSSDIYYFEFGTKDMLKSQWKHVQVLADEFWNKWQKEYLNRLQIRKKWTTETKNLKEGDLVLFRDAEVSRNQWPMAIIEKTFPSSDDKVRKVQIRVARDGNTSRFVRPVNELISLMEVE